ncbi:chaperone DnaJ [Phytophthora cinnamomi]|uniref:chaperone DnaJ n=1 Tax=Phytophthora cinnamomi TaxID=4785 RepID=UPI00355A0303|nr:chaperone DnaJ [Phytophthora cinnamomi]
MATRRRSPALLLLALALTLLTFASDVSAFGFNFGFDGGHQEHHHEHEHDHVDFYETLGLTMEASEAQIKKAYRKLSLKFHPDKNKGDEEAESRFHEISRAYEVLSDPQKRQVYDLEGFEGLEREEQSAGRPSSPFDAFFGGGGKQRGPDAAVDMAVTLEELYNGAQKQAQFSRNVICRKCRGTGAKGGKTTTCKTCGGSGHVLVEQKMGPGFTVQMQQPCPKCGGKGKTFKHACPFCHGNKVVKEDKVLTADIERGMPSSHQIVFERESEQRPGMVPGDVIFRLHQVPHNRFRRAGDDLHYDLDISLEEALLGYKKPMKHLDDRTVVLTNAKVTTPFEVRTVEGEGMPVHNYPSQHGNLHVHHEIRFPKKLSVEQKELVKELLPEDPVTAVQ